MKSQGFNKTAESSKEADRLPIPSRDDLSNDGRPGERAAGLGDRQDGGPAWATPERDGGPERGGSISRTFLWMYVGLAGSLLLRLSLFEFESGDYRMFLSQWYDFFRDHGRLQGLARAADELRSYCYPAVYMYLISLSTLLPLPKLYAIKLISILADYVGAWFVFKIVRGPLPPSLSPSNGEKLSFNRERLSSALPIAAALAFLFLPTVVMNGALWGQCDILYATGLLASLFYVLERRPVAALVAFGVACSLKPQAIFLGPLIAGLFVSERLPWKHLWVPTTVYVGCAAPAVLAGQPVWDALAHWTSAAANPPRLTLGAPNWYQWLFESVPGILLWPGVALTLAATATFVFVMQQRPVGALSERQWLVSLALLSVLFPPFLMPGVHERYFFSADILSVVYAFLVPARWTATVLIQFASAFAYVPYLFGKEPVPYWLLALVMAAAIGLVASDLARAMFRLAESNGRATA